jgi:hypothetical protein
MNTTNMTAADLFSAMSESALGKWNYNEHNADAAAELVARGLVEVVNVTAENNKSRKTMGLVRVCHEIRFTPAGRLHLDHVLVRAA